MTDKKGKRAVVINNIKSGSIEQAIFILKPSPCESAGVGSAIVAEAQQIINNYICMIEGHASRRMARSKKITMFVVGVIGILTIIAGVLAILK